MSAPLPTVRPEAEKSVEWYTPPSLFAALRTTFDLDPCAPPLPAARWLPPRRYSLPQDGLSQPWTGRVWLNPPYGRNIGRWVGKLAAHGDGVALVFVRSDAEWWQRSAARAGAICLLGGRVRFVRGDGAGADGGHSPAPACLLAYGPAASKAVAECGLGLIVIPELSDVQTLL